MWIEIYGKREEKPHYGQISETCTGTSQSCTGTGSVLFFCFDQRSYFGHTLLIYDLTWVIQVAG